MTVPYDAWEGLDCQDTVRPSGSPRRVTLTVRAGCGRALLGAGLPLLDRLADVGVAGLLVEADHGAVAQVGGDVDAGPGRALGVVARLAADVRLELGGQALDELGAALRRDLAGRVLAQEARGGGEAPVAEADAVLDQGGHEGGGLRQLDAGLGGLAGGGLGELLEHGQSPCARRVARAGGGGVAGGVGRAVRPVGAPRRHRIRPGAARGVKYKRR